MRIFFQKIKIFKIRTDKYFKKLKLKIMFRKISVKIENFEKFRKIYRNFFSKYCKLQKMDRQIFEKRKNYGKCVDEFCKILKNFKNILTSLR